MRIVFGNRRLVLAKLKQLVQADNIVNRVFSVICLFDISRVDVEGIRFRWTIFLSLILLHTKQLAKVVWIDVHGSQFCQRLGGRSKYLNGGVEVIDACNCTCRDRQRVCTAVAVGIHNLRAATDISLSDFTILA